MNETVETKILTWDEFEKVKHQQPKYTSVDHHVNRSEQGWKVTLVVTGIYSKFLTGDIKFETSITIYIRFDLAKKFNDHDHYIHPNNEMLRNLFSMINIIPSNRNGVVDAFTIAFFNKGYKKSKETINARLATHLGKAMAYIRTDYKNWNPTINTKAWIMGWYDENSIVSTLPKDIMKLIGKMSLVYDESGNSDQPLPKKLVLFQKYLELL